jgi:hypothetical protein
MRWWLLIAMLAACEKAHDHPAAAGSGSADALVDGFTADMTEYGVKATPIMLAFNGDCGALADKMLVLEPLAQRIRARGTELEADPARYRTARERMRGMKAEVIAKYEAAIAPATMADAEKKEAEIKAKCRGDASYEAAMERVGLMKKK